MLKAREAVWRLPTYHPPLGGREGLRLDFNENTVGCSPRVLERLQSLTGEELARYPEREPVEAMLAKHLQVTPEELLLTNGADEAIHLVCEGFLEAGDEAIVVIPTFAMYEICAAATGAKIIPVPAKPNFRFPTAGVLEAINRQTRLIAIANPNNPTGAVADPDDLAAIARRAPEAAVLIDEAYYEFYGNTMLGRWRDLPNLFVARTFSKAYGLAGMRVGVLTGAPESMAILRKVSSPYNVNSVALACLPQVLADEPYIRNYVAQVKQGRERLEAELRDWAIEYWASQANFVLMRLGRFNQLFIRAMRGQGILVRDRSNDSGCAGCVRITIGTSEQTDRLLTAMRASFETIGLKQPEAV
jgi:histidinol-phosphate aminotransferase